MALFVKPNHTIKHDGKYYGDHEDSVGSQLPDMPEDQAKALLDAGVVTEGKQQESAPTEEEVAATAEQAGEPSDGKKGLFR